MMSREVEESGGLVNVLLMVSDEGEVYWKGVLILYVMPLLTCVTMCCLWSRKKSCKSRRDCSDETALDERD
jgi:hypothetical protein